MLTHSPFDSLVVAHRHGQELRTEAAAERLRGGRPFRHRALAAALRWTADRLDPTRLATRPAGQP
jgi:hypothetical protein